MNQTKNTIKDWAEDDRPREKMLSKGIQALSNAELLAILIGSGTQNESALDLSKNILSSVNNNLNDLARLRIADLCKIKGIGNARAVTITAAIELGRRRNSEPTTERPRISTSKDVFSILGPLMGDLPHEEFRVLFLNRANIVIDSEKVSQGGITGTVTDIRIIMKLALEKSASSIIACHNHPSGNLKPSESDIQITQKIKDGAKLLDIGLLDHVIVSYNSFYSFADEGLL